MYFDKYGAILNHRIIPAMISAYIKTVDHRIDPIMISELLQTRYLINMEQFQIMEFLQIGYLHIKNSRLYFRRIGSVL